MSLRPQTSYTVPEETARVARAIFPRGHHYLRLADTFGSFFQDVILRLSTRPTGSRLYRRSG